MIIPFGFAQVTHWFGGDAYPTEAATTYGVDLGATLDPNVLAQDLHTAYSDFMLNQVPVDVVLRRTHVKFGPNASGPFGEFALPHVGEAVGTSPSPNTAVLVQKRTLVGGRSGRGRMYVPSCSESVIQPSGAINGANVDLYQDDVDDWKGALDTITNGMVILHNSSSDPTSVISLNVSDRVATQRRRLRR